MSHWILIHEFKGNRFHLHNEANHLHVLRTAKRQARKSVASASCRAVFGTCWSGLTEVHAQAHIARSTGHQNAALSIKALGIAIVIYRVCSLIFDMHSDAM